MNMGTSNGGMNGGLVVFMTTANNLVGGTLTPSPPHKHNSVDPSQHGKHWGVPFVYFSDVKDDGEVEVVPFQKSVLVVTDSFTVQATIERLLQVFAANENADLGVPHMVPS